MNAFLAFALVAGGARTSGAVQDELVARRMTEATAAEDLFHGAEAIGGIGDWYLTNGIVEAIVDDVGFQEDVLQSAGVEFPLRNSGYTGGALVDLGLVGRENDQFGWLSQVVDYGGRPIIHLPLGVLLGDPTLPSIVASVESDAASLTVYGWVHFGANSPLQGRVLAATRYSLHRGERLLRVRTSLTNTGATSAEVPQILDAIALGVGGLNGFLPYAEAGFRMPDGVRPFPFASLVGSVVPEDGVVDTTVMLPSGEASYTVFSPEQKLVVGQIGTYFLVVGTAPRASALAPGSSFSYTRRIAVGERNDVASSADLAIEQISSSAGEPHANVYGRLAAPDGFPFRASVELRRLEPGSSPIPTTQVRTDSGTSGFFAAVVPPGDYELHVAAEERPSGPPVALTLAPGTSTDAGVIDLSPLGRLTFTVTDSDSPGRGLPAKLTLKGRNGTPDPDFGVPIEVAQHGKPLRHLVRQSNPAYNMSYTTTGAGELFVAPGDYTLYASRGMEYTVDVRGVSVSSGTTTDVTFSLTRVVDSTGWVSADFHVHAARSPDSSVPPLDRVANFAAEDVNVMVASDHNLPFDYQPLIEMLGLESTMTGIVGVEASLQRSSPDADASASPRGHWNGWPQRVDPLARRDGAPEEGYVEPNVVFDRLRAGGADVIQLNHPFRGAIGYLGGNGFDPAIPADEGANVFLQRQAITGSGTRNVDFDTIEIYNGGDNTYAAYRESRSAWFSLLSQGILKTGTAVTDTHSVAIRHGGFPRTYVASAVTDFRGFDVAQFDDSVKRMRAFGTSGPFLEVVARTSSGQAGLGEILSAPAGGVSLDIRVQAPCWIPVQEVRVFANGVLTQRLRAPWRCPSPVRFQAVVPVEPAVDTYFVVEAGQRTPSNPSQQPWFPAGIMGIVEPSVLSLAFTNPIFIDVDGNGQFDPPGLTPLAP